MRKATPWIVVVLGLGLLGASAATRPAPPPVAVVDMAKLFAAHPGRRSMEQALALEKSELEEEVKERKAALERLQEDLAALDPKTTAYREKDGELYKARRDLEFRLARGTEELQRKRSRFRTRIVREIEGVVDRFARAHGYDLVLQRELVVSREELSWKSVLFCAARLDVTDAVISAMIEEGGGKERR